MSRPRRLLLAFGLALLGGCAAADQRATADQRAGDAPPGMAPGNAPTSTSSPATRSDASSAGQLATDDDRIYFAAEIDPRENHWADSPSVLRTAPKSGGKPLELLRSATRLGPTVIVHGEDVFYARDGAFVPNPDACPPATLCQDPAFIPGPTGAIATVPKRGGAERVLVANVARPGPLAIDGDAVYFVDGETLGRVSRNGGPPEILARGLPCSALGVGPDAVFCGGPKGVRRIGKEGGPPVHVAPGFVLGDRIIVLGDAVAFALSERVWRTTPAPPPTRLAQGTQDDRTEAFVRIAIVAPTDTSARTLAPIGHAAVVISDGAWIFWSNAGALERVSVRGGTPQVTAPFVGHSYLTGLALDREWVYWLARDGETGRAPR